MKIIWSKKQVSTLQIRSSFNCPKPHINTIATFVKILCNKGFLEYIVSGRGYIYFPVIDEERYINFKLRQLVDNYFDGSFGNLVVFYASFNNASVYELEALLK